MSRYAQDTAVPVAKSRAEIEDILLRFGAHSMASGFSPGKAVIVFVAQGRRVQFELPLPDIGDFAKHPRYSWKRRTAEQQQRAYDQELRRRWRSLALVIKAKLEAVNTGITSFEDEFLAHIVLPSGGTVGKWLRPQLAQAYETQQMPPLLGAGDA